MLKGKSLQAVQAMEKTLELLEVLANYKEPLNIGKLADKLSLNRREVVFLLVTLESREMVIWDQGARVYRPGRASLELARAFHTQHSASSQPPKTSMAVRAVPLVSLKHKPLSNRAAVGAAA